MDPNAEGGPPKADLEVIEAEVEFEGASAPPQSSSTSPFPPYTPPNPFSSSSIFRNAYSRPQPRASSSGAQGTTGNEARAGSEGLSSGSASFEEMEEVRKANEAEFERRLKGEYMAAQQRLGQVVSDNMDRPMRLSSIRLSPSPPISRSSFLNSLLSPFITPSTSPFIPSWLNPAPPPPRTLHEILFSTRALVAHLDRFGVYNMEESSVRLETKQGGDPDEVELVLGLKERGRFFLKAGTEVGGNEGGGNITARLRNALGGGETLEGQASIGTKTKSAYSASLSTPLLGSPLLAFALSAFSFDRDNTAFASHREQAQGARAKLSAIAPWGAHDLTYEYIQREITGLLPKASVSIRELARPSTKSSLTHTWLSDTRDDPYLGTSGRMLKLTHEYAGLPGSSTSAHFLKSVTQSHLSRALYEGSNVTFSIASLTSLLYPLSPRSSPTELPDRLFLGGPNSVRGWKVGGMGLHDSQDSLGGEMAWGMGLSVFAPLWPGKEAWPARLHGFLNAGKISGYNRDQPFSENIAKMYNKPNLSAGLGLMYRLDPIRIEVNFSMPLVGRKGERMSRGFGVGVGLEFL